MKKLTAIITILVTVLMVGSAFAQFDLGADAVSRYVWRGAGFGTSPAIQPGISYALGSLEIGAWASYSLAPDADNGAENDLYLTYSIGDLGITLTDYYFPESMDVFNYSDEDAIHILEASASYGIGPASILAAVNFSGDADNSKYVEAGYDFYDKEGVTAGLSLGLGDGMYAADGDFALVSVGLSVAKDNLSASYIINPDTETNFLVFGYSF